MRPTTRRSPITGDTRRCRSRRGARRTSPRMRTVTSRCGASRGTAATSRVSASTGHGTAMTTRWGGSACSACDGRGAARVSARRCSASRFWSFAARGKRAAGLGVDAENTTGAVALYERVGLRAVRRSDTWERSRVSTLRARCPDCRTITAVAIDDEYQCHSCGREYAAGLVRVPRAWGAGGDAMAEAAHLPLPYPEAGGDRGGVARGPDRRPDPQPPRAAARPRRLLLLARRGDPRPRGPSRRPARGGLDRCPRRPQHARELAVRQRVGDAAADGDRCRRRRSGRRRPRRRAEPRSARARVHGGNRNRRRPRRGRSTAATASTSRSTATCSFPASSPSSCPSRVGRRSAEAEELLRDIAARCRIAGLGLTGLHEAADPDALVRLAAAAGL